jgi:titin
LDASGRFAVPNGYSGIGIWDGPVGTLIGGTNVGARNIISGNNDDGISLSYSNVSGVVIQGNYLGTDFTGTNAVPNGNSGVNVFSGAHGVTIGGASAAARNIISGNGYTGVILQGAGATNNLVQGNYVGTDPTGSNAVANAQIGVGVWDGATGNLVGGTNAGAANVASGNLYYGILVSDLGTSNNVVQGNYAGTDPTGKLAVPNGSIGIVVGNGATGNLIGGPVPFARNIISGNGYAGVALDGVSNNLVQGNYVGTSATGSNAIPNAQFGVGVWGGATGNLVGGTNAGAANVISGNANCGVFISDVGTSNNLVQGNYVGTDATATFAVPNSYVGVAVGNGANNNVIGGAGPGAGNLLSGNASYGALIAGLACSGNVIQGNMIGTDLTGKRAFANGYAGLAVWGASTGNLIGGTSPGAANVISANGSYGLFISDTNTSGNLFQGNLIGTDITGTNAMGNGSANVILQSGADGNSIGGIAPGAGNIIAFSGTGPGVVLFDPPTTNNAIRGNSIFGNAGLGIDLNNDGVTPNHTGFLAGPNDLQNFPIITNAVGYGASTIISGTLNSLANRTYWIDVYRNVIADPSGYGQGQFYFGAVSVNTDGSGNATFALTNNTANYAGQYFAATATSSGGDTSEFGACRLAASQSAPSALFSGPFLARTNGFIFALMFQTNFSYRIQTATNLGVTPIAWMDLTNFTPANSSLIFTDRTAISYRARFYRVVSP